MNLIMRVKRRAIILAVVVALIAALHLVLPGNDVAVQWYSRYLFHPFQQLRGAVFNIMPVSVGDILYIAAFVVVLMGLVRWVYFLIRWRTHKRYLSTSILNGLIGCALFYLIFFIGWGGNYYKPSLTKQWHLNAAGWDTLALKTFDETLIERLNRLAPVVGEGMRFRQVNRLAEGIYGAKLGTDSYKWGLGAKPSVFGYLMQYMGIQGYYNPFTGEAQVNRFLPQFMLPFVVCHEMAHQSGIAAEDDANLLAYVLCASSDDVQFQYSGTFNLWLYTHNQVRMQDTIAAKALLSKLNIITHAHLDTLRSIRRKYQSDMSNISGDLYDGYLRMHGAEDGIDSYDKVTVKAWAWELGGRSIGKLP